MRRILVVDDTKNVQLMLTDFLSSQGYEVSLAYDGVEAMKQVQSCPPDLILLDVMMPNMDGFQFISQLRRNHSTPVIMITARQQEEDIVRGFDLGADDYITKPFRMRELLVRLRAVMRRTDSQAARDARMVVGDLILDAARHELHQADRPVELTPIEFQILQILMQSCGKVVRRQDLSIQLMDHGFTGSEGTLKIHIRNIRQKLQDDLAQPRYIETIFGIGYRLLEVEG